MGLHPRRTRRDRGRGWHGEREGNGARLRDSPITNSQFQTFVDRDHINPEWWRDMPPNTRRSLDAPKWPEPSDPRENVSWYDAVAFCRWLSHRLGYEVSLPTEFEWQQAATGGNEDNVYPWGPNWDASRTNSAESGLNRTTVVGAYPHGASAPRVLDLAGNVQEWCLSKHHHPEQSGIDASMHQRVSCGGSWNLHGKGLGSADWDGKEPYDRRHYIGFRVVCRPHSSADS